MERLPDSLTVAGWLAGSLWAVGAIAYLSGAPGELVVATGIAGAAAAFAEITQRAKGADH
jgi:hypothetical protein